MATKTKPIWRVDRQRKFLVLHRDGFACRYCGIRPGSELLEVDHLVPRACGGTDNAENLVTSCKTCNGRKSDTILFPHDLIERQDDDGWFVHKTFGEWLIVFSSDCIGIDNTFGYGFIDSSVMADKFFWSNMHEKAWPAKRVDDVFGAAAYLGRLMHLPLFQ